MTTSITEADARTPVVPPVSAILCTQNCIGFPAAQFAGRLSPAAVIVEKPEDTGVAVTAVAVP
jgi:hypothetical protein